MPYINAYERNRLSCTGFVDSDGPGHLNFAITSLIKEYIGAKLSYQKINDVIGALEGAKLEFYRRVAVPYENAKMAENGDVYS